MPFFKAFKPKISTRMTKRNEKPEPINVEQDRDELERQRAAAVEYRDWAIQSLAKLPAPRPGSGVNLQPVSERLQLAADAASTLAEYLGSVLEGMPKPKPASSYERPHSLRYVNMSIIEAVQLFLNKEGKAQTEDAIIAELSDGGAILGRKRNVGEIKKSLETNERNGTLRRHRGKYGMAEWGEDKFE
jgi:hypothetical protein